MSKSQSNFGRQAPTVGCARALIRRQGEEGFTLVELTIVVAVVLILAGLLLPALSRSKLRAQAVSCMSNNKQLLLAWTLYSGDYDGRLAYNLQFDPTRGPSTWNSALASPTSPNWVNNIMDWELSPDNTNTDFVNHSLIGPYASFSAEMFHCPADHTVSSVQRQAGWYTRVRSVSMNAMVGNPGSLLVGGSSTNINNPGYEQYLKDSDISDPSTLFVFLDEHPDSINDGYFLITDNATWSDLPASYHNGGGSFSFADGHTVIHHWRGRSVVQPAAPDIGLPIWLRSGNALDMADFNWVLQHSSQER
jgi:prepilin-type N-terminal cleavage/methylation domain-containing protein/prepilin-type processing-associated H-X9-DG protein